MKVAELQQTLLELGRLLGAAGAKGPAGEIANLVPALDPFRDQTLAAFGKTLGRVDESGRLPPKPERPGGTVPKAPKADPNELAVETKRLYDGAANLADGAGVEALCERLAGLTAAQLKTVGAAIEFRPTAKTTTKPALIDAIRHRIADRAGASIRRQLLDRPVAPSGGHATATPVAPVASA